MSLYNKQVINSLAVTEGFTVMIPGTKVANRYCSVWQQLMEHVLLVIQSLLELEHHQLWQQVQAEVPAC